jgi:hypothetical protein
MILPPAPVEMNEEFNLSFSLDGKRNKKIKAKANAPLLLPGQRT